MKLTIAKWICLLLVFVLIGQYAANRRNYRYQTDSFSGFHLQQLTSSDSENTLIYSSERCSKDDDQNMSNAEWFTAKVEITKFTIVKIFSSDFSSFRHTDEILHVEKFEIPSFNLLLHEKMPFWLKMHRLLL